MKHQLGEITLLTLSIIAIIGMFGIASTGFIEDSPSNVSVEQSKQRSAQEEIDPTLI